MTTPNGGSAASGAGFTAITDELRTHAAVLTQVAGMLGQAMDAARQVTLGDQAYGQLPVSAAFSGLIRLVAQPAVGGLAQAQSAVTAIDAAMRTAAANYDTVERDNTGRFTGGSQ